jgi:hypothetical protein
MPVTGSIAKYAVGQAILLRDSLCRHSSFGNLESKRIGDASNWKRHL